MKKEETDIHCRCWQSGRVDKWLKNHYEPQTPKPEFDPYTCGVEPLLKAERYNKDKLNFSDMPLEALIEVAKVTTMGAKKYGRLNWQKGQPLSDLADATLRHLIGDEKHKGAFTGERVDPESGLLHLAHAAWNILTIIHQLRDNEKYKQFIDLTGYKDE